MDENKISEELKVIKEAAKEAAQEAAQEAGRTANRALANNELLTRIDERLSFIRTIDLVNINNHLATLNNNVAKNTGRSSSNKAQIRNMWIIIIAHLGLLGTILGLIIYSLGR